MKRRIKRLLVSSPLLAASGLLEVRAQSADWQNVIWREPQVRYLIADMSLGGNVAITRKGSNERICGGEVKLSTD